MFSFWKTHSAELSITVPQIGFNDSALRGRRRAWVWRLLRSLLAVFPAAPFALRVWKVQCSSSIFTPESWIAGWIWNGDRWMSIFCVPPRHPVGLWTLFICQQTNKGTHWKSNLWRLGSADRLLPLNVQTGSISGTRVSDCAMGIKGKQQQWVLQRLPPQIKRQLRWWLGLPH